MKKIFNKVLAGITATAMVATLLVGINVSNTVKADSTKVTLTTPWSFFQTGTTTNDWNAWELCAYSGVTFGDSGVAALTATDFPTGSINTYANGSEVTVSATGASDNFTATIRSNGWSADYDNNANNPYTLRAFMDNMKLEEGHSYTLSFSAAASPTSAHSVKYATIGGSDENTNSLFYETICIEKTAKTFTYDFAMYGADEATIQFMFGAFAFEDSVVTSTEVNWEGSVTISDVVLLDNGLVDGYVPAPPAASTVAPTTAAPTTVAPTTVAPTTAAPTTAAPVATKLAQVKKVKAKNTAAGKVKVTWKKVTNASQYKVKVGKKTYKTKKTKLVVKKLAVGTYKVKVRALKTTGYKAGAWSKAVKVKVTK